MSRPTRPLRGSRPLAPTRRRATALALVALVAGPAGAADARSPLPDLRVTSVAPSSFAFTEGVTLTVRDTTVNRGRRPAGRSTVRFYLSTDVAGSLAERRRSRSNPRTAVGDVLLVGARPVPRLRAGGRSAARRATRVTVPIGTPPGRYVLLACADDRGVVRESREDDNCRAARRPAEVRAAQSPSRLLGLDQLFSTVDADEIALITPALRQDWCEPRSFRELSLRAARRSVDRRLRAVSDGKAMAAFRRSPAYRTARAAESAAAAAAMMGQPGAALAALMRAHGLEPGRPAHLVNAAGLAGALGMPNEALAMLDAAARLDDRVAAPLGVPRQAVAQVNRGQALLAVGRYADARRALTAAARHPMLSEASALLAAVDVCERKDPLPAFRRAQRRKTEGTPEDEVPPVPPLDVSNGVANELRTFKLPRTPEDVEHFLPKHRAWEQEELSRLIARNERREHLNDLLRAEDETAQPGEVEARNGIMDAVAEVGSDPDLQALDRAITRELDLATAAHEHLFGGVPQTLYGEYVEQAHKTCSGGDDYDPCMVDAMRAQCVPTTTRQHTAWLSHLDRAAELMRQHHARYSQRVSAIAGHLENANAYELQMLVIEDHDAALLGLLASTSRGWVEALPLTKHGTGHPYCWTGPSPAGDPAGSGPGAPSAAGPGRCTNPVDGFNFVVDLKVAALKANCDEVSLEASTQGWIAGFAEMKYDIKGRKVTVFGGSKAEIGYGPLKGDFKSGVYVTAGASGIEKAGLRAGPSYTVGLGGLEVNPSDMEDFQFLGEVSPR